MHNGLFFIVLLKNLEWFVIAGRQRFADDSKKHYQKVTEYKIM